MPFIKVKSAGNRVTYSDGQRSLVVQGDRGALVDHTKGAKKVRVSVSGDRATITQEVSDWLTAGHLTQNWLKGEEDVPT